MTNESRWPQAIRRVLDAVLGPRGESLREERRALHDFARDAAGVKTDDFEIPTALASYIEKLTHSPYKVIERDLNALRDAGYSEDQIFELTLAGALGAAAGRYERTLDLLYGDDA